MTLWKYQSGKSRKLKGVKWVKIEASIVWWWHLQLNWHSSICWKKSLKLKKIFLKIFIRLDKIIRKEPTFIKTHVNHWKILWYSRTWVTKCLNTWANGTLQSSMTISCNHFMWFWRSASPFRNYWSSFNASVNLKNWKFSLNLLNFTFVSPGDQRKLDWERFVNLVYIWES